MTTYYGFEHAYGQQMSDGKGGDLGECHAFASRKDRDQWVSERSTEHTTERGYRETYSAKRAVAWVKTGMVYRHN